MKAFITIAVNTFLETIRNKVLYNILLVAAIALFFSMSFGDLSVFSRAQVIADFGLTTMSITGLLLAVFIGVGLLGKEISSRTVYLIVTKPVSRDVFILGKFSGLLLVLTLNMLLIALVFFISIVQLGTAVKPHLFWAILLIMIEMGIMVSVSIFFSTLTNQTLAAIFTISFYVSGHLNDFINIGLQKHNGIWNASLKTIYYLLPNLEHFNIRTQVIYGNGIPGGFLSASICYGVLYMALFLFLSIIFFSEKDL